ncbi:LPXTG cell wall anchor domain-containing protein [Shouchella patagoniensis]|uniref:LPXTG cell wall anchor domain-containing protein n=1 Tax=Shouchella patagoniensis TaxID=228576 RepID=UPI001472AF18|nr:LPXTG cell wall anchor domain-containing protein [Shouchella patagoniensis]
MSNPRLLHALKEVRNVKQKTLLLLVGTLAVFAFLSPHGMQAETETNAGVGFYGEYPTDSPIEDNNATAPLPVLPQTGDSSSFAFVLLGIGFLLAALVLIGCLIKQKKLTETRT